MLEPTPFAGDPFFANVVLLCHCDGTAGSTTFTDTSPVGRTLTALSTAKVETTQVKAGTGAADLTGGSGPSVSIGGSTSDFDFRSAQFTVEAFVYATSSPGNTGIICQYDGTSTGGWYFGTIGGNIVCWYLDAGGALQTSVLSSSTSIPTGAWHHVAMDRDAGGIVRLYLDGVVVVSATVATFFAATAATKIGNSNRTTETWTGYIDEARVTKGAARYAGAFTVPSVPFPDTGISAASQARVNVLA